MSFIKIMGSLFFIIIFSIAIISFTTDFGNSNDVVINLNNDEVIRNNNLNNSAYTYIKNVNDSSISQFEKLKIESGDDTSVSGGVFKAPYKAYNVFADVISLINKKIFGGETGAFAVVGAMFTTFISLMLILYAWKTWAGKNPD